MAGSATRSRSTAASRRPSRCAPGERVRLRLINAANARIFGLELQGHRPIVIALDGQPVEPHEPAGGRVVLGPAMRADLVIDMIGEPGERFTVADTFYRGLEYRLLDLVYADEPPLRLHPLDAPLRLAANTMPEPDLGAAERHEVSFGGGMMGGMTMAMMDGRRDRHARDDAKRHGLGDQRRRRQRHVMEPFLTLQRGRSYVLAMRNDTAWHHPMHLHGHAFRVTARDGQPTRYQEWQDTVLMAPRERVEIAFVADNPGDWMFHCHILEHQAAGMMGVIRVT